MHSKLKFFQLSHMSIHAALILFSFWVIYHVRQFTDFIPGIQLRIPPLDSGETILFAAMSAILFVIIGHLYHVYTLALFRSEEHDITHIFLPRIAAISCVAYFGFWFLFVGGISRFILVVSAILSILLILVAENLLHYRSHAIIKNHEIWVYGNDYTAIQQVIETLSQETPYQYIVINDTIIDPKKHAAIVVGDYPASELQRRIDSLRWLSIPFFHIPSGENIEHAVAQHIRVGSFLWWSISTTPLQDRRWSCKRITDICLVILWGILLLPLLIVIALIIKRDSTGPIFYIQKRIGRGGKIFDFVKFRSMFVDDCIGDSYGGKSAREKRQILIHSDKNIRKGILQKIQDDPRVTKVGRFLRKTSLDELPSLRNVLIGEMSLVGPRPHMPHEVAQYQARHKRLLTIKPGITWYAQLYGRDTVPFDEEAKLDLWYIQHWSFSLDLYILLATCKVIVKGR